MHVLRVSCSRIECVESLNLWANDLLNVKFYGLYFNNLTCPIILNILWVDITFFFVQTVDITLQVGFIIVELGQIQILRP